MATSLNGFPWKANIQTQFAINNGYMRNRRTTHLTPGQPHTIRSVEHRQSRTLAFTHAHTLTLKSIS
uniref:Uncharacterized protein n=1 Tax=Arundo donax TaxID=35708 RepID=A0A0A8ZJN4_ARUDO